MSIKKVLVSLALLGTLCAGILFGAAKPETAEQIVAPAEAAQCEVILAVKQTCLNDGCSYVNCRPTNCSVGWNRFATKSWGTLDGNLPPTMTFHAVTYKSKLTSAGTYPTYNSYFNDPANWD